MRGTVAKRLRRQVTAEMPGQYSELVAVRVKRGPARMAKLRARAVATRASLVSLGHSPQQALAMVPDPARYALIAETRGPRREYRRRKRAHREGRRT